MEIAETPTATSLPVGALIGSAVEWIPPDATLSDAARRLTAGEVGVLVIGDGGEPTGVVSERDLVHAMAAGLDPATTRLVELASTDLVWCDVEATVGAVGAEMMRRYVRHVLVEDGGALVGVVSQRDLLGVLAGGADLADG